jgi:hypothetical protein
MKICPQCQTEYDDTKNFCRHDGTSLETPQTSEKTSQTGESTCSQCGKPVQAGEQFCSYCGAKLEGASLPIVAKENLLSRSVRKLRLLVTEYYQQLPPEKREFHRGAALGFGAAFLIILGFVGYWKTQESPQPPAFPQTPAVAKQNVPAPPPQDQFLSSSFARTVTGSNETRNSEVTTDRPPVAAGPREGQPPGGGGTLPSQEQYYARGTTSKPPEGGVPPGTYRVTTPTPLRSEPDDDAPVVIQLKSRTKIRVVRAVGDYLEVHSKKGRAPGYVLKDHAVLVQRDK